MVNICYLLIYHKFHLFLTLMIRSPVCTPARIAAPSVREINYSKCNSFACSNSLLKKGSKTKWLKSMCSATNCVTIKSVNFMFFTLSLNIT